MRVIQYGPKEEEIVCNHCDSLLAYTEKDEYWEWYDLLECLPKDCTVYDRWGKLEEVYY
jgi:hypothetical protein